MCGIRRARDRIVWGLPEMSNRWKSDLHHKSALLTGMSAPVIVQLACILQSWLFTLMLCVCCSLLPQLFWQPVQHLWKPASTLYMYLFHLLEVWTTHLASHKLFSSPFYSACVGSCEGSEQRPEPSWEQCFFLIKKGKKGFGSVLFLFQCLINVEKVMQSQTYAWGYRSIQTDWLTKNQRNRMYI